MGPRERLERLFYAVVGAGDSWIEDAGQLLSNAEKRQKRVETLVKRGKKRVSALEKDIRQRRSEIRERVSSRIGSERFDEVVEQAREVFEPVIERLPSTLRDRVPSATRKRGSASKQSEVTDEAKAS